ncbi:MAG: AI-2E family transporter [Solirubrobacteraceae bacterium]|jgi:predicted PurR-regulated permease PerM|nr:AI-2E family transporter [Solirubrobacteraceae bacterium]
MRFRATRSGGPEGEAAGAEQVVQVDVQGLAETFSPPRWLRDLGLMCWLLVGVVVIVVGLVWLVGTTYTITIPVILGSVIAAVAAPVVRWLQAKGVPRAGAAVILMLALIAALVVVTLLVVRGIVGESDAISSGMNKALDEVQSWLNSLGVTQTDVKQELEQSIPTIGKSLLNGAGDVIGGVTSIATVVVFTAFSTFFLLKDGPSMRRWAETHSGLPDSVARVITGDTIHALQAYFTGVTIVALFNAVLIGGAAVLLGVPIAGTIFVVTFVGAYVPFIGAWVAGIFAVGMALSTGSETDAIVMSVVALLANGVLQQIVQPIAYGATLKLNPLVVLVVTIGGGALFGMVGLVLAAPLTSAAVSILGKLAASRADDAPAAGEPPPAAAPAPA